MRYLLFLMMLITGQVAGAELSGKIELRVNGKALRAEEAADAVVYFRQASPPPVKAAKEPYIMSMQRKQFSPRVLPVTVGSRVRFPNFDPIIHNAFSTSSSNAFDVGFYSRNEGETVTFSRAGYIRVYCNVHHSMMGHILVLDTPWFSRPVSDGSFQLKNLPAVPGDLVVWHDRASPWRAQVTPGSGDSQNIQLELNQPHISPHMNKFGKPYGHGAGSNGY